MVNIENTNKYELFSEARLSDLIDSKKKALVNEINTCDKNDILSKDENTFIEEVIQKYKLEVPVMDDTRIIRSKLEEKSIDVSWQSDRYIRNRNEPFYIKGKSIKFTVPFTGNPILFKYTPSTFYISGFSRADIGQNEIYLEYEISNYSEDNLNEVADLIENTPRNNINTIREELGFVNNDVSIYNNSIEKLVRDAYSVRKKELKLGLDLEELIKIPLKQRTEIPEPLKFPLIKKKIEIASISKNLKNTEKECVVSLKDYNDILKKIKNMSFIMEQNPKAMKNMGEEDIRWIFLVVLNGHYEELSSTGETFNYEGKTDILIKWEKRNVFICECKIWRGKEILLDTIDQLQKYITWRDTKTSICIFNRNKVFSKVLSEIELTVREHPCFEKFLGIEDETIFRYKFHRLDDPDRKYYLTILAFNIPE